MVILTSFLTNLHYFFPWIIDGTRCEAVEENNVRRTLCTMNIILPMTNKADGVISYSRAATPAVISDISAVILA